MTTRKVWSILLLLGFIVASAGIYASEESAAQKADDGIKKGAKATGRALEKGSKAAEHGLEKGGKAAAKGIKTGGRWVGKGLNKAGKKLEEVFK